MDESSAARSLEAETAASSTEGSGSALGASGTPPTYVVYGSRMAFEGRQPGGATQSAGLRRIRELGLKLDGSPIEPLLQNLYKELDAAGIGLKPPFFIADEWGCPDGVPAIGVPFYLV